MADGWDAPLIEDPRAKQPPASSSPVPAAPLGNRGSLQLEPQQAATAAPEAGPVDRVDNWETRNNNFGGIRKPGIVAGPNAGGFKSYGSAEEGVGDIARLLRIYQTKHGLDTIRGIVSRWAPPNENDTNGLIARAAKVTGFGPDDKLDLSDNSTLAKMIEATIRNEHGGKLPVDGKIIGTVAGAPDWYAPARTNATEKISPQAIATEQKRPGSRVMLAEVNDLISALPEETDTPRNAARTKSLRDRLLGSDGKIDDLPVIDVSVDKDGRARITDYDGLQRLKLLAEQGYEMAPIAIRGIPKDVEVKSWVGMRDDKPVPFQFAPVPQQRAPAPSRLDRFGTGVRDVVGGATQLAAHLIPQGVEEGIDRFNNTLADAGVPLARVPERNLSSLVTGQTGGIDQMERDRMKAIEAERAGRGETGTDWWRVTGNVAGTAPAMAIPGVGEGVGGALATGAIQGALGAAVAPVTGEGGYWGSKLAQVGEGAALGAGIGAGANQIAKYIAPVARAGVSKIENSARQAISQRFADRAAGSGAVPAELADTLSFARSQGQPMTLADAPELAGMAGTVSRSPGEAGARMKSFFAERRQGAMQRLDNILSRYLPTGSVKRTVEELASERSKAAAPLYREAFEGGSLAPLEKQFEKEWNSAAAVAKNAEQNAARIENELNTALAKKTTAGNVYSSSAASRATKFAQDKIKDQRKIAEEARAAEQSALARLRRAQQDGTADAPGAVWSPTIQRLVGNPRVQVGIRKGMKIERDMADAEGRPMNLREYAIIGTDEAGEPIVGAVPNMRLLAAAKKGLDAMVADMRSPAPPWRLTEEGRAVDKLRRSLLDELYTINPKYREANELWSGGQTEINALVDGQRALDRRVSVEDVRDQLAKLPERARDFYRLGVADEARKDLLNSSLTADKSKAIVNSEGAREKLRTIIGSEEDAARFVRAIENERTMFNTERAITGGSQTAERHVEDSGVNGVMAMLHAGRAVTDLAHGHVLGAISSALRGVREVRGRGGNQLLQNPTLANEVSRLLTNPNLGMNYTVGAGRGAPPMLPPLPVAQAAAGPARNMLAGAVGVGGQALPPAAGAAVASGP